MDVEAIQREISEMDKRLALLEQKVDQIDRNVCNINTSLSKILWIVGGGFIASIVAWIVGGGLGQ
jgi:wobble nucleotide-excising tRNase